MIPLARPGFSLSELIVALVLGSVVCGAILATLASASHLAGRHLERIAWNEARRIVIAVLDDELRYIEPRDDLAATSDTLGLRAFRGIGIACEPRPGGAVARYRGLRLPEPAKDSVLVLDDDGGGRATGLAAARALAEPPARCVAAPDETVLSVETGAPLATGTLLLVFEAGSYHLADRAFRYRRGHSGRQPLTAEVFERRPGSFDARAGVELVLHRPARPGPAGSAAPDSSATRMRYRIVLLNAEGGR